MINARVRLVLSRKAHVFPSLTSLRSRLLRGFLTGNLLSVPPIFQHSSSRNVLDFNRLLQLILAADVFPRHWMGSLLVEVHKFGGGLCNWNLNVLRANRGRAIVVLFELWRMDISSVSGQDLLKRINWTLWSQSLLSGNLLVQNCIVFYLLSILVHSLVWNAFYGAVARIHIIRHCTLKRLLRNGPILNADRVLVVDLSLALRHIDWPFHTSHLLG